MANTRKLGAQALLLPILTIVRILLMEWNDIFGRKMYIRRQNSDCIKLGYVYS